MEWVIQYVLPAVFISILGWLFFILRNRIDRRRVYKWLRCNTKDEPGESHVETVVIAKGTRIDENRVRKACMSDHRIKRYCRPQNGSDTWSVWREKPPSIYEKRGVLRL